MDDHLREASDLVERIMGDLSGLQTVATQVTQNNPGRDQELPEAGQDPNIDSRGNVRK